MAKIKTTVSTLVDARIHSLYCGVTQSGKTTLARHHARLLCDVGYDVVIYDPVLTETAGGDWFPENQKNNDAKRLIFHDSEKFLKWLVAAKAENDERPIFVFVDESADIFGHQNTDANWLPRRVRHQGIYLRLISQRPKMLPPNVRSQTAHCYMFRLASDDAKMVLADYGHDNILSEPLDSGDFVLLISGSSSIERHNVFELIS